MKHTFFFAGLFLLLAGAGTAVFEAGAQVLFSDTFNRTTFGTNDNGLGGTITAPWVVANAMGAAPSDMDASQLHLLGGASPDHNFVDPTITAAGGFVISFTVAPFWGCVPPHPPADGYWGGIGLGMSAADGNVWFYAAPDADFALLLRNNCNYEASSGSTPLVAFNQTPYTTNFTAHLRGAAGSAAGGVHKRHAVHRARVGGWRGTGCQRRSHAGSGLQRHLERRREKLSHARFGLGLQLFREFQAGGVAGGHRGNFNFQFAGGDELGRREPAMERGLAIMGNAHQRTAAVYPVRHQCRPLFPHGAVSSPDLIL